MQIHIFIVYITTVSLTFNEGRKSMLFIVTFVIENNIVRKRIASNHSSREKSSHVLSKYLRYDLLILIEDY